MKPDTRRSIATITQDERKRLLALWPLLQGREVTLNALSERFGFHTGAISHFYRRNGLDLRKTASTEDPGRIAQAGVNP